MRNTLLPPALLALLLPAVQAITLSDFQPIHGFSTACTNAYDTPLQGCFASDFQNGNSCSTGCITFLEALTKILNTECKGTSAFPDTLIGLFFTQQGTSTLCPNLLGASDNSSQPQYGGTAAPGDSSSSTSSPSSTKSSAAASSSTADTTSSTSVAATSSSTTVTAQTTASVTSTSSSSPLPSSSSTSQSTPTSKSSSGGNGGGTLLDVGSSSSSTPNARVDAWMWTSLAGFALLAWLF